MCVWRSCLKLGVVLVPCNPSFLQRQRLGENSDSFNHNWFKVSVKLHLTAVKLLLDTVRDMKEKAEKVDEQMKRFQLFSELRKYFQRLCQWKEKFRGMWSYLSQRKTRDKKTFSKIIHSSSNKRTLQSFISVVPVNGFKMGSLTTNKKEKSLRLL